MQRGRARAVGVTDVAVMREHEPHESGVAVPDREHERAVAVFVLATRVRAALEQRARFRRITAIERRDELHRVTAYEHEREH